MIVAENFFSGLLLMFRIRTEHQVGAAEMVAGGLATESTLAATGKLPAVSMAVLAEELNEATSGLIGRELLAALTESGFGGSGFRFGSELLSDGTGGSEIVCPVARSFHDRDSGIGCAGCEIVTDGPVVPPFHDRDSGADTVTVGIVTVCPGGSAIGCEN